MFKYAMQLMIGLFLFTASSLFTWYEGSALLDQPWEWPYSTPFSSWLQKEGTISQLDYFVYAAKYEPLFPVMMLISSYYIASVTALYLISRQPRVSISFWGVLSCVTLLTSGVLSHASTKGGQLFCYALFAMALISLTATIYTYFYTKKIARLS